MSTSCYTSGMILEMEEYLVVRGEVRFLWRILACLCSWKVCEVVRKGEVMGRGVIFVGLWWRRVVFVFVWLANLERL